MVLRILVTGSSGLVGEALIPFLISLGHKVTCLVRQKNIPNTLYWDPERVLIPEIVGFDVVIHLSGQSVASRWTDKIKQEILSSRVKSTLLLSKALAKSPPKLFICASAVGFYGNRGDEVLTENSPPGSGFLASVVQQWEAATEPAKMRGIRCVHARFGTILSKRGGALPKMMFPFRLGLGTIFGSGTQYMSWIAIEDVLKGIEHLIHSNLEGAVNFTSPNPVTNRSFCEQLAKALHRPLLFRIGERPLKWFLGEMAEEMLLTSERVMPEKLVQSGYQFSYPTLSRFLSQG
ncbi:MAG: TIGR01777 family oxidoreductase [Verrucomicrobia bacterium]|nr:TIGR01777 family oxidoreductase [Verrucomicrobiota bacterium]